MKTRVNKANRPTIAAHVEKRFDARSQNRADGRTDYLSIIDIWDVQFELEKLFDISDQASQRITWDVLDGAKFASIRRTRAGR
jgi:hypothetical protein